ncbi:MAG: phage portal protein [Cyanobacteria bacterium P01_A01_bin.123]
MDVRRQREIQQNIKVFQGDFWPDFWIGPTVPPSAPDYTDKMAKLERVFQSANIIQECVNNWRDGLISEPFTWYLKGQDGERVDSESDTTAAEAEIELQRWIDWVEQQAIIADPHCSNFQQADPWAEFVLSLGVTGEGALRLWQPARYADAADPIHRIHLHVPKAGSVAIKRNDADGFIDEISYSYNNGTEVQTMEGDRVMVTMGDDALAIDTGGRWLTQYVNAPSLLSSSVKRLQSAVCHAVTMLTRNTEISGFRERVFMNAEYPTDDDGNPIDVQRGPGIDTYTYGLPTGDPTNPGYTPVGVYESQPVDNASLTAAIETYRRLIYMQFNQGHLLSAGDGSLSGESRIQMRSQFELNLKGWKRRVESAISNTLNIVLRVLGYEGYEVSLSLNTSSGKLSSEEQQAVIAEFQAGLLSKTTAISKLGSVRDPDAELTLIAEEEAEASASRDLNPDIPNQPLMNPLDKAKETVPSQAETPTV